MGLEGAVNFLTYSFRSLFFDRLPLFLPKGISYINEQIFFSSGWV